MVVAAPAFAGPADTGVRHWRSFDDIRAVERAGDSLWVGTSGGLLVYDLLTDSFVDTAYGGGRLPSSSVRAIRAVGGRLLVGTDAGLSVFSGGNVKQYTRRHRSGVHIPLQRIRAIDVGPDGTVYVSSFGLGLGVWQADTSWTITRDDSLLDNKVYGVVAEKDSSVYFATSMGLCAWRDSLWVNFQAGAGIPRGEIRGIARAAKGSFDILIGGRGVFRFDGVRARRLGEDGTFPEDEVTTFVHDAAGVLWAAGRYGVIAYFANGFWNAFASADHSALLHPWRSAGAGPDGDVYFGATDGTIVQIEDGALKRISVHSGLPYGRVDAVLAGNRQKLWMVSGARVGIVAADGSIRFIRGLRDVADMTRGPGGVVWVCSRWGVFRMDEDIPVELSVDIREKDAGYCALAFDTRGDLWILLASGAVYRFDGEIWLRAGTSGLDDATRLIADASGGIWLYGARTDSLACERFYAGRTERLGVRSFGGSRPVDMALSPGGVLGAVSPHSFFAFDGSTGAWRTVVANDTHAAAVPVHAPAGDRFRAVAFDERGTAYLACDRALGRIEHGVLVWNQPGHRMGGADVRDLAVDGSGHVWIAFERDGLAGYPPDWFW